MLNHYRPSILLTILSSMRFLAFFSKIKHFLISYTDVESLKSHITEHFQIFPKEENLKTFHRYLERMQIFIDNRGD